MIVEKINRSILILIMIVLSGMNCERCNQIKYRDLSSERTIASNRQDFLTKLRQNTIYNSIGTKAVVENEKDWISAFWAMELIQEKTAETYEAIEIGYKHFDSCTKQFQRALLEATYCLYPQSFRTEMNEVAKSTDSPKLFAMAINYLMISDEMDKGNQYMDLMRARFPNWKENPLLKMLAQSIERVTHKYMVPSIKELISCDFFRGKSVVFCFQRENRDYSGVTIIKQKDGQFYRTKREHIFSISHLARSVSNMPGYLTNGNSPQGIYSIQGIDVSDNVFIGPSPTLQLVLPYEVSPQDFFHSVDTDSTWRREIYEAVLPESWKDYLPIWEVYFAGKAGRSEIIAHGTTINPDYYRGFPFYPNTPSLGCITATELWSPKDGGCIYSDQVKFINAIRKVKAENGYFVLINIDNVQNSLHIQELLPLLY